MKQKLLKTMLLLSALVAGTSSAWATDYTTVMECDLTTKSVGCSAYNTSTVYGDWTIVNGANNNKGWAYFKMGGKSATLSTNNPCYIYSTAAASSAVDKVTVHIPAGSLSKSGMSVTSWGLYVYSDKSMNTQIDYVAGGTITSSEDSFDFTPSAGKTWSSGYYYKVSWDLANTTTTNGIVFVDKITLYEVVAAPSGTTASPTISGDTPFLGTTTVTITNDASADGADIYYTLNGEDPTTTTSATCFKYSSPFELTATTTVKAIAKHADDTYASSVVPQTFTKVTPLTVAEGIAVAEGSDSEAKTGAYVHGFISQIDTYNSNTITYWISDDGTKTSQLEVYRGKGLNNANFTAITDLVLGDEVVVYGNLTVYSSTPEFASGNYIKQLTRKPSPELAWSAASYAATYGSSITYPTLTNPNSVSVTYSSSDTNVATIDPSTGEITLKANGSTSITASFAGNATYRAQEVSYTLTVTGMKTAPGFSFATAEVNMTYDEDYTGQALTNPNSLTVTYESSDTDVADVDEDTGELVLYKAGTVTITANYAGDATYASGSASYTINVTKAAAGLAFASVGPFTVAPDADFDVPAFTNPHSLTVAWSSSDEDVAVANATTAVIGSKLGTAVITATFAGDDRYNASEVSYTIIVTNDIEVTWDLSTNSYDDIVDSDIVTWSNANVTMENSSESGGTSASNYLGGDANKRTSSRFYNGNTLTITPLNGFAIKSVIFTAASESYATALATSTWTNASAVASSKTVTITPKDGTNAISAVIGGTTGHTSVVVNLGKSFDAKLNSAGYATFAAPAPLDFSDDSEYSAWQITAANSSTGKLTFSQITGKVEAGTGVLLKGTASAKIYIPVAASGSDISSTNLLEGITAATAVAVDTYYGLSGDTFKKVNAGTVPAGKALLPASEVSGVKAFTFVFEDEADGISLTPALSEGEGVIYNLAGQRISKMQKGINIVNGKKVLF